MKMRKKEMNAKGKKAQKKPNKALNIVLNVVVIAIIIFAVILCITAVVSKNNKEAPNFFGITMLSIQSDSMEPEFYTGDLIIGVKVDPKTLVRDDVITFHTIINGEPTLNSHRVIDIKDNGTYLSFTTRGDNSPDLNNDGTPDDDAQKVHQNEIVSKYLFRIPWFGNVIDFLQKPEGFLLVIVLPVLIFFIYNLVQFFRVFFEYRTNKIRMQLKAEMMNEKNGTADPDEGDDDSSRQNK